MRNCGWRCARGTTRPPQAAATAAAARAAEMELWRLAESAQQSSTLDAVFARAGVTASADFLASYYEAWDPHTLTDPDAPALLRELRRRGIKIGVLSNTMWPRAAHERIFVRDEVFDLIDGAVYSSEIPWVKPHPEAFRAAMRAIGVTDPAELRVRRRPAVRRRARREERGHARRPGAELRRARVLRRRA